MWKSVVTAFVALTMVLAPTALGDHNETESRDIGFSVECHEGEDAHSMPSGPNGQGGGWSWGVDVGTDSAPEADDITIQDVQLLAGGVVLIATQGPVGGVIDTATNPGSGPISVWKDPCTENDYCSGWDNDERDCTHESEEERLDHLEVHVYGYQVCYEFTRAPHAGNNDEAGTIPGGPACPYHYDGPRN